MVYIFYFYSAKDVVTSITQLKVMKCKAILTTVRNSQAIIQIINTLRGIKRGVINSNFP